MGDEVIKVLDSLSERFGIAIDWTSQNVMPYLQELTQKYILYKISMEVFAIVLCLILIISGTIYLRWLYKKSIDFAKEGHTYSYIDTHEVSMPLLIISIAVVIISTPVLLVNICILIKCLTIPELVMFEYIKNISNCL